MDKKEQALATFRKPYSCAQTIWAAFADTDDATLAYMKEKSGGRAPDNMCGALFAAIKILPVEKRTQACAEFEQKAGSCKCLEIKSQRKTPCEDCVKFAAEILEKNL